MKIAILSDSHDNVDNVKQAIEQIRKLDAEALLFCGDFCAPGPAVAMCAFNGPIYAVFGNNDGDKMSISARMLQEKQDVTFFAEAKGQLELGGRKIAMTHYPFYANALARSGDFDLVVFGHDHIARIEKYGECLAVNPGCLNSVRTSSVEAFAIYDTDAHAAQLYALDGSFLTV